MSGLEAQQMSNWSDNYCRGALMSLSAALLLTSDAAFRWRGVLLRPFRSRASSSNGNVKQTVTIEGLHRSYQRQDLLHWAARLITCLLESPKEPSLL